VEHERCLPVDLKKKSNRARSVYFPGPNALLPGQNLPMRPSSSIYLGRIPGWLSMGLQAPEARLGKPVQRGFAGTETLESSFSAHPSRSPKPGQRSPLPLRATQIPAPSPAFQSHRRRWPRHQPAPPPPCGSSTRTAICRTPASRPSPPPSYAPPRTRASPASRSTAPPRYATQSPSPSGALAILAPSLTTNLFGARRKTGIW
jgi:hypothetical protein